MTQTNPTSAQFSLDRICTVCGDRKFLSEFSPATRGYMDRKPACRECSNAKKVEHYHANRAQDSERRSKRWRENLEENRRKARERYAKRPESEREATRAWRAAHRELLNEGQRDYRARNLESVRAKHRLDERNRRAVMNAIGKEYALILERDPCSYCFAHGGVLEHIDPVAKGGTGDWWNLTGACKGCNSTKGTASMLHGLLRNQDKAA